MTVAPECAPPGLITTLAARGVVVSAGHTNATADQANRSFDRGITGLTHVFNAMRPLRSRDPGIAGAALTRPDVVVKVIVDGTHLADETVRLVWACAGGRVALITDAMAAAGSVDGRYKLGSLEVAVVDGVARLAGPDGDPGPIAGSTLTLDRALQGATQACGLSLRAAVTALTWVPARVLGLEGRLGRLTPGYAADAVLLSGAGQVQAAWGAGRRLA